MVVPEPIVFCITCTFVMNRRALAGCVRALAGRPLLIISLHTFSCPHRVLFHIRSVLYRKPASGLSGLWEPDRPVCVDRIVQSRAGPTRFGIVRLRKRIIRLENRIVQFAGTGLSGLGVRLTGLSGRSPYINRSPARLRGTDEDCELYSEK